MKRLVLSLVLLVAICLGSDAQTISNTYKGIFIGNARQAAIDMTNMDQSGASVGSVPTWNGTYWVPELGVGIQVAAGPGLIAATNGNIVTISTNGMTTGGSGTSITNGFNPQYFTTTVISATSNYVSFIPQNVSVDTRPMVDADVKGAFPNTNTLITLFTNFGPCTIVNIHVDWVGGSTCIMQSNQPWISIWADGVSNGCQMKSFFASQGDLLKPYHAGVIDNSSVFVTGYAQSGTGDGQRRKTYINCQTSGAVAINFPFWGGTGLQIWTDVLYLTGTPVDNSVWHCVEKQQTTANNTTFSIASIAGTGHVEELYMYALCSIQGYLESRPALYLDGNLIQQNGTEDQFGGSWYFNYNSSSYHTPDYGNDSGSGFLQSLYGLPYGNSSYWFFGDSHINPAGSFAYFNSTLLFNYTNGSGVNISNDFLITYRPP